MAATAPGSSGGGGSERRDGQGQGGGGLGGGGGDGGLSHAPAVGVNREIERAFLACPDHERIMTIQALAAVCTPWQRHLFLAILEQSRGTTANGDIGVEAVRLANDADHLHRLLYPVGRPQSIEQLPLISRTVSLLYSNNVHCADKVFAFVCEMLANDRYVGKVLESRTAVLSWKTLLAVMAVHPAFADAQKYYYVRDCMVRFSGTSPPPPATVLPPISASPTLSGLPGDTSPAGAASAAQNRGRSPSTVVFHGLNDDASASYRPRALKSQSQELVLRLAQAAEEHNDGDRSRHTRDRSSSIGATGLDPPHSGLRPSTSVPLLPLGLDSGASGYGSAGGYSSAGGSVGNVGNVGMGNANGGAGSHPHRSISSSHDLAALANGSANLGGGAGSMSSDGSHHAQTPVAVWLRSLRLHKYTDQLQNLEFAFLMRCTEEDLVQCGVSAQGARRKMLLALQANAHLLARMNMLGRDVLQPGMFQHTLTALRDLFDQYRDQQVTNGVVVDVTTMFMSVVERAFCHLSVSVPNQDDLLTLLRLVRTAIMSKCLPRRDHTLLLEWRDDLERLAAKFGFADAARHAPNNRASRATAAAAAMSRGHPGPPMPPVQHSQQHPLQHHPQQQQQQQQPSLLSALAQPGMQQQQQQVPMQQMQQQQQPGSHYLSNAAAAAVHPTPASMNGTAGPIRQGPVGSAIQRPIAGPSGWPGQRMPEPAPPVRDDDPYDYDDYDLESHSQVSKSITDLIGMGDDDDLTPSTSFDFGLANLGPYLGHGSTVGRSQPPTEPERTGKSADQYS